MTPDQIDLSRRAMVLPGAPVEWATWEPRPVGDTTQRPARRRDSDTGILWSYGAGSSEWLPDLGDAATGGVLLGMLGAEAWRVRSVQSVHKRAAGCLWYAETTPEIGACIHVACATLAEACCHVALARGRWPGGEA